MFYANTNAIVLKGLEHLQILVSMGGDPGIFPPWMLRDDCSDSWYSSTCNPALGAVGCPCHIERPFLHVHVDSTT
jgi:hypothetical protein